MTLNVKKLYQRLVIKIILEKKFIQIINLTELNKENL
jgi:hypothetical protein